MDMMEYIMNSVSDMSEKQLKCLCYFIQALKGLEAKDVDYR